MLHATRVNPFRSWVAVKQVFLKLSPNKYCKIIRFFTPLRFNAIATFLVSLKVMRTGHAGPTGYYGCFPGQSGHFGGSHAMKTQSFKNIQKSVFGRTFGSHFGRKDWKSRLIPTCARLNKWSEGFLEPPFWIQLQYGQKVQNAVFCKLNIIGIF